MEVIRIEEDREKQRIAENILEVLPEWFGIPEARAEYVRESAGKIFLCAMEQDEPAGFLYLKETGKDTLEIAVLGVRKEFHRRGIGKALFERAKAIAKENGYSFLQVKTVQMGKYESYDATNRFYRGRRLQGAGSVSNPMGPLESLPGLCNGHIGKEHLLI